MPERKNRTRPKFSDIADGVKSAGDAAAQSAQNVGDAVTQGAKSVGEAASQGTKAARTAASQGVEAARETVTQGAKSVGETTSQGARAAGNAAAQGAKSVSSVAVQGVNVVGQGVGAIGQRTPWDSVSPKEVRDNLIASIEMSASLSQRAKRRLIAQLGPVFDSLFVNHVSAQAQVFAIIQGLLASDQISREINSWLQGLIAGRGYDVVVDLDFHQTLVSDYAVTGVSQSVMTDDGIYEESIVLIEELAQYDASYIGISVSWVNDLVSYDIVELIAGSIGILAVALNWNNDDVEEFSNLVGAMGLSSVVSANPLMMIVTLVSLARAFHLARKSGDWKEFSDGIAKGGVCVGAVLLATSLISGPAVVVMLTGICVGILANQATKNVSFVEIAQFMVNKIREFPPIIATPTPSPSGRGPG